MRAATCLLVGLALVSACSGVIAQLQPFQRWRAAEVPSAYPSAGDYLRVLSRWPAYAETDWREVEGESAEAYYGPGESTWGMMCHASAMFCYALLAADPDYVPHEDALDAKALISRVNQGLKFMTRRHVTGDALCTDGKRWSDSHNQWHSATWAENMGAAADLVWDRLTPENREAVRRVLAYEAERLSAETIPSGDFSDTKAESNAWDASVLARAAVMFPDDPRAAGWRLRAIEWAMNTLSVPQDAEDETVVDGRPVREWVSTVNVHRSFASENHGYYHVCYMWWPMWCLASAHYSFASHGRATPQSMYHHWTDLFAVLKRCYLADGRFAYVGGKDWPRWVYGLTAAMPAYVVLADELGEPAARAMEREAFRRYEWEQLHNGDGSFLGKRLADLKASGPNGYRSYCRYEADEAIMLGLAYQLHKLKAPRAAPRGESLQAELTGGFECPEAEIIFRRDPQRFVGWGWKTRTRRPQGIVALPDDPGLCEWDGSLCGSLEIDGVSGGPIVTARHQGLIEGGLWAAGTMEWGRERPAPGTAPRWLRVADDNVRVKGISRPDHPIFTRPNRLTDLAGLTDLDSITEASADWTVLAENERGGPSILEAEVGRGRILLCMNDADTAYLEHRPGGNLFENLMARLQDHAAGKPIGYIAHQTATRPALEAYGLAFEPVARLASSDLSAYGAIVMDRGSNADVRSEGWRLVRFVEAGGLLLRFCLQDTEWEEDQLSGRPVQGAVTHHIGCLALPDGRTTVVCELARANRRLSLRSLAGLNWHLGNDIFNGNRRTLFTAGGKTTVNGVGGEAGTVELPGNWLNVDGKVGMVVDGAVELALIDRPTRTAPHQSYCYETLVLRGAETPEATALREYGTGEAVLDHVAAFFTGTGRAATARLAGRLRRLGGQAGDVPAVAVAGPSGREFVVAWNFGEVPVSVTWSGAGPEELTVPAVSPAAWEIEKQQGGVPKLRRLQ